MLIKILRNTVADKRCVRAGDVVEVPKEDGQYLIAIGAAMLEVKAETSETAEAIIVDVDIPPLDEPAVPKKKRKKQGDE